MTTKTQLLTQKTIHGTTACYPGESFTKAISRLANSREAFGNINISHIQLCPQTLSTIDTQSAAELVSRFPNSKFRLHANVRRSSKIELFDASSDIRDPQWHSYVSHMKAVNAVLGNNFWSIHAGRATVAMPQMYDNLKRIQDFMGTPVGIEGLYPSKRQAWNLSSFEDYAQLLEEDVYFALDLSHIQITATKSSTSSSNTPGMTEWTDLIVRLMEHKNCLEIHLSDNDHEEDTHKTLTEEPWWWSAFNRSHISDACLVFTEGNQLRVQHEKLRAQKAKQLETSRQAATENSFY